MREWSGSGKCFYLIFFSFFAWKYRWRVVVGKGERYIYTLGLLDGERFSSTRIKLTTALGICEVYSALSWRLRCPN